MYHSARAFSRISASPFSRSFHPDCSEVADRLLEAEKETIVVMRANKKVTHGATVNILTVFDMSTRIYRLEV
ncbi:hypothetical protein AG1IA_04553 [Rhizoctonia solani AG-1 IA]|uniref:Uncharacterized protein n=1 Tax=Thanatephorus cucumeris (strain AG1-IA) TaxID=983506 RepID=L8WXC1_THACA|nr:hypothetical protein AG1IA_04553 [Rhizoctonia solani AG-1 IA]